MAVELGVSAVLIGPVFIQGSREFVLANYYQPFGCGSGLTNGVDMYVPSGHFL